MNFLQTVLLALLANPFPLRPRFNARMADNRSISQLEAESYPWIGYECCKGTVWVPFMCSASGSRCSAP